MNSRFKTRPQRLSDGSALPSWVSFDTVTQTFSGTPDSGDEQIIDVVVTATGSANQSVSLDFNLNVGNEYKQWRNAA